MPQLVQGPRKILLAAVLSGGEVFQLPLAARLRRLDDLVREAATTARREYPGRGLDLVVLPEAILAGPGATARERALPLAGPALTMPAALARELRTYLIVPIILAESADRLSNAAVLYDRGGAVAGIYRKVHPVAAIGSDVLEDGTAPGREFPVFACDFGRLGIQICWDMSYPDGWVALARQGAEIVAVPSASPQTSRPASYALAHRYYVVTSTPRDNASIYNPLGLPEARITSAGALVHEIDLAYAVLHWSERLEEGRAFVRRFGERIGFRYSATEDTGIFWSNDPALPIGEMLRELGLADMREEVERMRRLQDAARGGAPACPPG